MKRFKTEKELLDSGWKIFEECYKLIGKGVYIDPKMFSALGEPFDKTGNGLNIPKCTGTWTIIEEMLTNEILLPIGTKVAIPKTALDGELEMDHQGKEFLYYNGINKEGTYHLLTSHIKTSIDVGYKYHALEILEAHERFIREQKPMTPKESFKTEFKVGDWVIFTSEILKNQICSKIKEWGASSYCTLESGHQPFKHLIKLATQSEIQDYLIQEAKRRGYKNGTIYKNNKTLTKETLKDFDNLKYHPIGLTANNECLTDGWGGSIWTGHLGWSTIIESTKTKEELLIEEDDECESASVYAEGKWAEIVSKSNDDCIPKKGEYVKIIDFGNATPGAFTLNEPYELSKDLNKENGFEVIEDDHGNRNNGWGNAFELGMKFEKCINQPLKKVFNETILEQQINKLKSNKSNEKSNKQKTNGETIKTIRKITTITESERISGECISVKRRSPKITTGHLANGTVIRGK